MYKNIHFEQNTNTIHLWDDVRGYSSFKYRPYAYKKDEYGEFESIYGDRLSKIPYPKKDRDGELFESDVNPKTRVLVDMYLDSDIPSEGITTLTYDIEVEMETGVPDTMEATNTITSIAGHDSVSNDYFVYILDEDGGVDERFIDMDGKNVHVKPFSNEIQLLNYFLNKWNEISPDVITGWNLDYFDNPYLYHRLKRVLGDSEANRLSPISDVYFHEKRGVVIIAGVTSLDYLMLYKKFTYSELDNYRLDTVGRIEVNKGKIEYEGSLDKLYKTDINKFVEYNLVDVDIVVELDRKLQFIDLARGICHIGHVSYDEIVFSSRYLEGAILTYLKRNDKVAPNRTFEKFDEDGGAGFSGAYVKEPVPGKYDWIYDLDLTSLYPSIIMSLNISPETKIGKIDDFNFESFVTNSDNKFTINGKQLTVKEIRGVLDKFNLSVSPNGILYDMKKEGCIPEILKEWFDKRVEFRKLEKEYGNKGDTKQYQFYKQRQLIQKILLNSLYGVLGLQNWRFFDLDNAEAVTTTGVKVIQNTAKAASKMYSDELGEDGDYVTYIDTDSIFCSSIPLLDKRHPEWRELDDNSIAEKVNQIASDVQSYLNSFYDVMAKRMFNIKEHRFEIKKEYVAKAGFWVAKKRYAQWIISDNGVPVERLDVKGLDTVRSSFPKAFRSFMSEILIDILNGKSEDYVSDKITKFKTTLPEMSILEISKSTGVKNLDKYKIKGKTEMFKFKKSTPAHVKAAIAYNQLLDYYKCPYKYPKLKNGDKIKWAYLKTNKFGLSGLAFTGDEDPPEIMKLIETYIDYDKIFERELLSKFTDFFSSLGWGGVITNKEMSKKFFDFG